MYKTLLITLFLFSTYSVRAQSTVDTFRLYFDLNVSDLNKNIEKKIDLLVYNDKIINGSSIMIIGYADFLGSEGYNKNLSMVRAKNIKDYLVKYGIEAEDIKLCLGKGKIERKDQTDKDGYPVDRRVDIVVNNQVISREFVHKPSVAATTKTGKGTKGKKDGKDGKDATAGKDYKTTGISGDDSRKSLDIKDLTQLKEGQTILLKNVYFHPGSHIIKQESYETLEKLYHILNDNPKLKINIEGHVCCIHDVPDALDIDTNEPVLSLNRAKAIYNYLVRKGISEDRLQYIGFGKQHPIVAFEKTEEDADKNRRVEIRIVSNQ